MTIGRDPKRQHEKGRSDPSADAFARLTVSLYIAGPAHLSVDDGMALGAALEAAGRSFFASRHLPHRVITHGFELDPRTDRWLKRRPASPAEITDLSEWRAVRGKRR